MSLGEPNEALERVMNAVCVNMRRIDPANDPKFKTKTLVCDQVDIALRDEDILWPSADEQTAGVVMTVTDIDEDYEYFTRGKVRSHLTYEIVAWIKLSEAHLDRDPHALSKALRGAIQDLHRAFWYDYHLDKADSQIVGTPGSQLVVNPKLERVEREYRPPEGSYRATLTCLYDFSAPTA